MKELVTILFGAPLNLSQDKGTIEVRLILYCVVLYKRGVNRSSCGLVTTGS